MDKTYDRQSNTALIRQAVIDIIPLSLAVIPWGVLTGALAVEAGFSVVQAQLMSLIVFAGAAQLSAIVLFASGASFVSINVSAFVISGRHLLYSLTFRQHVARLPLAWRLLIGFLLTDEMFAVSEAHTKRHGKFSPLFAVMSGAVFYLFWNAATFAGIIAGDYFSDLDSLGFDFAIVATFIAMTFGELRKYPVLIAVLVSGFTSIVLKPAFIDSYIILAALLGMLGAYLCSTHLTSAERGSRA